MLARMTAIKVFMGTFAAIGVVLTLLCGAWGLALGVTNGWDSPAQMLLSITAGIAAVTAVVVGVTWLLSRRTQRSRPTQ